MHHGRPHRARLEGTSLKDKICFFPTAKGGIAAGWAFYDIRHKGIAPRALVFGVTNPVMVQGAVFAGITITDAAGKTYIDASGGAAVSCLGHNHPRVVKALDVRAALRRPRHGPHRLRRAGRPPGLRP